MSLGIKAGVLTLISPIMKMNLSIFYLVFLFMNNFADRYFFLSSFINTLCCIASWTLPTRPSLHPLPLLQYSVYIFPVAPKSVTHIVGGTFLLLFFFLFSFDFSTLASQRPVKPTSSWRGILSAVTTSVPQSNHSNRSLCHFCSPPTVPCFAFQVPVALLLFFYFTSSVSKLHPEVHLFVALFLFFLRLRVPQRQKSVSCSVLCGAPPSSQRNQKHFFLLFLVVAGGRTAWGESSWLGVVGWGVAGCGMPSGGSPTFQVRTTCPSCSRKSCSTLERGTQMVVLVGFLCTWWLDLFHMWTAFGRRKIQRELDKTAGVSHTGLRFGLQQCLTKPVPFGKTIKPFCPAGKACSLSLLYIDTILLSKSHFLTAIKDLTVKINC